MGTFNFDELPVGSELQRAFARWFAEKCAPGGGWDSLPSSKAMWFRLTAFGRFCAEQDNPPQRPVDITPALWNRWRMRRPEGIHGYSQVIALGGFFRRHEELSEATRSAMARRLPPVTSTVRALAPDEFDEVRAAARKMFRSAHLRIRANTEHLERWREGSFKRQSRDWLIGEALDSLARTGYVPYIVRESGTKRTIHRYVAVLGGEAPQYTWMRLFLSRAEAYALAVLLVMEFGLNATVASEMHAPRALPGG